MNKLEFIDHIAKQHSCTKMEAERIINVFTSSVASALKSGVDSDVTLVGFGKFYASQVAARAGRNPKTGAAIQIGAYVQPKFSAGQSLKDACNGK